MNLFLDNNDGLGQQDYTSYVDADHLPRIVRRLNCAATLVAALMASDGNFDPPVSGARIILQRSDGFRLFTGYLATAPEQQYLGYGQIPAWRYVLQAIDDSCLLDQNALPARTPFAWRTAGNALLTLANDVLPGGLDESEVQDVSTINQFPIVPQKTWTDHAQELSTMARATYRAHDGKLSFQPVGQAEPYHQRGRPELRSQRAHAAAAGRVAQRHHHHWRTGAGRLCSRLLPRRRDDAGLLSFPDAVQQNGDHRL